MNTKINFSDISGQKILTIAALCFVVFVLSGTVVYAALTLNATTITSSADLTLAATDDVVLSGNAVGIGTADPASLLDVVGPGGPDNILLVRTPNGVEPGGADDGGAVSFKPDFVPSSGPGVPGMLSIQGTNNQLDAAANILINPEGGNLGIGMDDPLFVLDVGGDINSSTTIRLGGKLSFSAAAPTVASGFGTSPSVVANNGTAAFTVNVGTGGAASAGVITMPAATTGWACYVKNLTGLASNRANQSTVQTATTTTSVTVQNQTISTGAALAWSASDVLQLQCTGY